MRISLFLSIMHKLIETFPHLTERHDVISRSGLTSLQKGIVALWQLAYGMVVDTIDEYFKVEEREFPDILRSNDYMHWQ
jgi:hypothetical protein